MQNVKDAFVRPSGTGIVRNLVQITTRPGKPSSAHNFQKDFSDEIEEMFSVAALRHIYYN